TTSPLTTTSTTTTTTTIPTTNTPTPSQRTALTDAYVTASVHPCHDYCYRGRCFMSDGKPYCRCDKHYLGDRCEVRVVCFSLCFVCACVLDMHVCSMLSVLFDLQLHEIGYSLLISFFTLFYCNPGAF
ncbi:hypothetical protein FGIG_06100, partial [Fasciola gigantica]